MIWRISYFSWIYFTRKETSYAHIIRETAPLLDKRHQLMLNDILKVCSNSLLESLVANYSYKRSSNSTAKYTVKIRQPCGTIVEQGEHDREEDAVATMSALVKHIMIKKTSPGIRSYWLS
jgi:hypothetical protein